MSGIKRVSLCLLLLLITAGSAGSNAANASLGGALGDLDDASQSDADDASAPLGDIRLEDDEPAASEVGSKQPAFLRKKLNSDNQQPSKKVLEERGIFQKALNKAIGGGVPGAIAGLVQVLSLMWLVSYGINASICSNYHIINLTNTLLFVYSCHSTQRTVINYQYRYGSSFLQALATLYGMGKIELK